LSPGCASSRRRPRSSPRCEGSRGRAAAPARGRRCVRRRGRQRPPRADGDAPLDLVLANRPVAGDEHVADAVVGQQLDDQRARRRPRRACVTAAR
jgi:hypothetical protein